MKLCSRSPELHRPSVARRENLERMGQVQLEVRLQPVPRSRSQAFKCWISAWVVPNFRCSFRLALHRRITTASIFLCTSMPAIERYTDSMLVSWRSLAAEDRSRDCSRQDPYSSFRSAVPDQTLVRLRHLQCVRQPLLPLRSQPFSSPLLCGTQWEHSCVPRRESSRRLSIWDAPLRCRAGSRSAARLAIGLLCCLWHRPLRFRATHLSRVRSRCKIG